MTKRKLYWRLLPPFFSVGALVIFIVPQRYVVYVPLFFMISFWSTYYSLVRHFKIKDDVEEELNE